jgi:hypothetical protein
MSKIHDGESVSQAAPSALLLRGLGNSLFGQQFVERWFACHAPGCQAEAIPSLQIRIGFRSPGPNLARV